eukprot:IDg20104t1
MTFSARRKTLSSRQKATAATTSFVWLQTALTHGRMLMLLLFIFLKCVASDEEDAQRIVTALARMHPTDSSYKKNGTQRTCNLR